MRTLNIEVAENKEGADVTCVEGIVMMVRRW